MSYRLTRLTFVAARNARDIERGLRGWAKVWLDEELMIDGVAVRRTLDGRSVVSLPARGGHPIVFLRSRGLRIALERDILAELTRQGLEA